jgi:hypothetical protein
LIVFANDAILSLGNDNRYFQDVLSFGLSYQGLFNQEIQSKKNRLLNPCLWKEKSLIFHQEKVETIFIS